MSASGCAPLAASLAEGLRAAASRGRGCGRRNVFQRRAWYHARARDANTRIHSGVSMKVAVEAIEGCKRRLAVEAPVDVVKQEWERAYGRVQKQARLPGFRKGHVPRSLVKVHFADDVRREVAEHLIPDAYRRALTEARLEAVDEPDLQDVKLEEGAPLSFVAVVEVRPDIALGGYKGIEVEHSTPSVGDEHVGEALEHLREQHAQFRAVERAAAPGDLVIVDYT